VQVERVRMGRPRRGILSFEVCKLPAGALALKESGFEGSRNSWLIEWPEYQQIHQTSLSESLMVSNNLFCIDASRKADQLYSPSKPAFEK
jgi:hypothetical protein